MMLFPISLHPTNVHQLFPSPKKSSLTKPKLPFDTIGTGKNRNSVLASLLLYKVSLLLTDFIQIVLFHSCKDNTIAGLWKRADSTSSSFAPFTKLMLSKLLVLNDSQTREEYFRQQAEFVTEHGRGDEFTEFSTDIQGTS